MRALLATALLLFCSIASAKAAPTVLSNETIDASAGVGGAASKTIRYALDSSDIPWIAYTRDGGVRMFVCDNVSCSTGTNEQVFADDGFDPKISNVVIDAAGGPQFMVTASGFPGYVKYVRCSSTTCASPTEWTTGSEPATPWFWESTTSDPRDSGLLLDADDTDAPKLFFERSTSQGIFYQDCDDGQVCDPFATAFGMPADFLQHIFFDAIQPSQDEALILSRARGSVSTDADFMATNIDCPVVMGTKTCTVTEPMLIDTDQFSSTFDGELGHNWTLPINQGVRDATFNPDGNVVATLKYQLAAGETGDADMFAMLECLNASCSSTDVTLIHSEDGAWSGRSAPQISYRPNGKPVFVYRVCEPSDDDCDLKITACNQASCNSSKSVSIADIIDTGSEPAEIIVDNDTITVAFRTSAGVLRFVRVDL